MESNSFSVLYLLFWIFSKINVKQQIQNSKYKTLKELDSITGLFLHGPHNLYIRSLLKAFTKAVQFGAHFDFDKLRQKHEVWDDTDE